eukprot:3073925-Prymnesium_polylepis.1
MTGRAAREARRQRGERHVGLSPDADGRGQDDRCLAAAGAAAGRRRAARDAGRARAAAALLAGRDER